MRILKKWRPRHDYPNSKESSLPERSGTFLSYAILRACTALVPLFSLIFHRLACLFGNHTPSPWREHIFEEVWLNCQHCKHSWREDDEGDYFAVSEGRSMTRPPDWKYYAIYYAAGIGIPFAMIVLLGMALGFIFAEGAVVP